MVGRPQRAQNEKVNIWKKNV